ncbi:vitamin B12-dependent ribonucleotide reductase [Candidatus Xianfuyuplasma coldseepsis]|uniref:Vitamin B12-dependent ribonucleotide reductase n=1 Tax=Candidatus Xianfuyuplasma coldseepsis TaxID=2782163 RepID=A0A7L7KRL8_9MOLU|nr:vitamin B12-dependent ribonucleotide reductase [Xianfuyuplasma coldseepsis]QMS84912.1 vitamin B12-dependent ribonucleotide reductase [Xianfuyuplasma coldseepsis]
MIKYTKQLTEKINKDIQNGFPHLFPITDDMKMTFEGVSRLVMLDRYTQKDLSLNTLSIGDLVITVVKYDPKFPARGIGNVVAINGDDITIKLEEESLGSAEDADKNGTIVRNIRQLDKPLELYFEQIAKRLAYHLGEDESQDVIDSFYHEVSSLNLVPAGRVLFGAGSNTNVTYFNCFVMPFVHDSRGGISDHRKQVMEIMSRGGGVGTNGSTLRPKNALAKGVNGKSSGAVSWLHDLSELTHLVEQGGSRRGAQMIMMADWHPDIVEFIISKMQNPKILQFLIDNIEDQSIIKAAKAKLKFVPLSETEIQINEYILEQNRLTPGIFSKQIVDTAFEKINKGGHYEVNNPDFLTGANISVAVTKDFMEAVDNDEDYELRFPDVDSYKDKEKEDYDEKWMHVGDVREWEKMGYRVKTYRTIRAKDLWNLINVCATYSAEPGIFFIDNANEMTNAQGYGQKVVSTNPCGEQPLAPYSVCNLAAINLANMVKKDDAVVDWDKLQNTIKTAIRMQDNVIDKTHYFLEENRVQALGERRIGLGIMGLHDLLIWTNHRYGSKDAKLLVDKLFKFIATNAYEQSIKLAKEKGSFPFLEQFGSKEKLLQSGYIKKLPEYIQQDILKHGIRNSHLLTIAPTGSTGTMVGVSTGLEPYFGFSYFRSGRLGKFIEVNAPIVENYLKEHPELDKSSLPNTFVSAMELTPEEHVDMQCTIQNWVDSSISKTVNAPKGYSVEEVEQVYMRLYKGGAKGGTVYVDGSRDSQVLTLSKDDDEKISAPKQVDIAELGVELVEEKKEPKESKTPGMRSDRQDRNIGVEPGDICPICLEGTVENLGGCHTCTNCNAQLKCGL